MTKRITVSLRIDDEVWKQVKLFSVERNMKISNFVETALIHEMRGTNGVKP